MTNVTISRDIIEEVIECMTLARYSGDETTPVTWLNEMVELLQGILDDC